VTIDASARALSLGPARIIDRLCLGYFNGFLRESPTIAAVDGRRSGRRPVGLIQVGRSCQSQNPGLAVMVLPGADMVPLVADLPPCTAGCRLDARRLAGAAERVTGAIAGGSDLVIINRFGRVEAGGGGLADLITCAFNASIPVLVAVPEHRFAALVKLADGMNVRLPCPREALDRW
jgi:hypothetical protein